MKEKLLQEVIGNTDIYLIDQILKGRYQKEDMILDAGCGSGRNIRYFYENEYSVFAIDTDEEIIETLKKKYSKLADNFSVSRVEELPFITETFDHIICNAVLHFAVSETQLRKMFSELVRVLKKGGSLFIRMTSNIGIEGKAIHIQKGIYSLPDGTERFLLTRELLRDLMTVHQLSFIEPVKSTNVHDLRSMTTLVLGK